MSIDKFIWVPTGASNDDSVHCRQFSSYAEMLAYDCFSAEWDHKVLLAHGGNSLVDEQYFFESADDARWFWLGGYKNFLFVDSRGEPVSYDRMTLWIDGQQIEHRSNGADTQKNHHVTAQVRGSLISQSEMEGL